jgi:hypothetical protein
MLDSLVVGFERNTSTVEALLNISLVERAGTFPSALAQRLEIASTSNGHITATKGLRERVQRVARAVS